MCVNQSTRWRSRLHIALTTMSCQTDQKLDIGWGVSAGRSIPPPIMIYWVPSLYSHINYMVLRNRTSCPQGACTVNLRHLESSKTVVQFSLTVPSSGTYFKCSNTVWYFLHSTALFHASVDIYVKLMSSVYYLLERDKSEISRLTYNFLADWSGHIIIHKRWVLLNLMSLFWAFFSLNDWTSILRLR